MKRKTKGYQTRLTDIQKQEIIHEYQTSNCTCKFLADKYDTNPNIITQIFKKYNIVTDWSRSGKLNRKYFINEDYFKTINTEDKAYFLGLLYSDGYNIVHNNIVGIQLQEKDKYILEVFSKYIGSNRPLKFRKSHGYTDNGQNTYTLTLNSHTLSQDLIKLGCVAKKSLVLTFPTPEMVPDIFLNHFIRGVIDGDGSIYIQTVNKKNGRLNAVASIVGTDMFCKKFAEKINILLDINSNVYNKNEKSLKSWVVTGIHQSKKFLDWVYKDATIFLHRKKDKYEQICNYLRSR